MKDLCNSKEKLLEVNDRLHLTTDLGINIYESFNLTLKSVYKNVGKTFFRYYQRE